LCPSSASHRPPPSGDAERAKKGCTGGHDANDGDNAPTDGDDDDVNMEE
jgi:hypothetical protein